MALLKENGPLAFLTLQCPLHLLKKETIFGTKCSNWILTVIYFFDMWFDIWFLCDSAITYLISFPFSFWSHCFLLLKNSFTVPSVTFLLFLSEKNRVEFFSFVHKEVKKCRCSFYRRECCYFNRVPSAYLLKTKFIDHILIPIEKREKELVIIVSKMWRISHPF